jgi:tripartite-type tricarboxylate transporter receptor subunit TctC
VIILRAVLLGLSLLASPTLAADRVWIDVGYSPGGSYDLMARLVADHIGKHIPGNPNVVVENVPGAGSLKLAKMTMSRGASDEVRIASVSSALALHPIFDPESTDFDPAAVHYLASLSNGASYCIAHKSSGITSLQQFLNDPDAKAGSTGKSSTTYTYPAAIKAALDGKFQIVTGFKGGAEIDLALERGDIDVRCGIGATSLQPGGIVERVNIIAELSIVPRGEFEGIDFALDFAPAENRDALALVFSSGSVHHPFLTGPDTPPETVDMLRTAFEALKTDDAFWADAKVRNAVPTITGGAEVSKLIESLLNSPDDIKIKARGFIQ